MVKNLIYVILISCISFLNGEDSFNFVKTPMTMSEASKNCQQWGGELVTIQNAAQNAYIFSEMKKRGMSRVWIGFNDIKAEGKFEWVDANSCSKYTNWSPREPNNERGNEDCTEIMTSRSGRWNDQTCTEKRSSICYKTTIVESQYRFIPKAMTMQNADAHCKELGGELATIHNAAQNTYIFFAMKMRGITRIWIGFNDIKSEGKFEWVDTNSCSKYTNWSPSEPNDARGNEDCTELLESRSGQWNDRICTEKVPSVCYKETGFTETRDTVDGSRPDIFENDDTFSTE